MLVPRPIQSISSVLRYSGFFREGKVEGCALSGLRLDPDPSAQPLQNLLANGQSDSSALELVSPVQPLEKDEDPLKVLRINPQAIVAHGKEPFMATVFPGRNVYVRDFGTAVLNCVPHEVLKYLGQLRIIRRDDWQRIVSHYRSAHLNRCSQVCKRFFQCVVTGNLAERLSICSGARIGQQILD